MLCLKIRMIGFKNLKEAMYDLCINEDEKILHVLKYINDYFGIALEPDEIIAICNDKQIYIDEPIPKECKILILFPLALGGGG